MKTESIYRRTFKRRLPKQKRIIHLPGADEDRNKWIRCWNCGFRVKVDRDIGDPEHSGIQVTDAAIPANPPFGSGASPISVLENFDMVGLSLKNDKPDGTPETIIYTPRMAEAVRGCPLCGTSNLL
jgi:hypothetical protein